jgi:hypothetical protein
MIASIADVVAEVNSFGNLARGALAQRPLFSGTLVLRIALGWDRWCLSSQHLVGLETVPPSLVLDYCERAQSRRSLQRGCQIVARATSWLLRTGPSVRPQNNQEYQ